KVRKVVANSKRCLGKNLCVDVTEKDCMQTRTGEGFHYKDYGVFVCFLLFLMDHGYVPAFVCTFPCVINLFLEECSAINIYCCAIQSGLLYRPGVYRVVEILAFHFIETVNS